MRDDGIYEDEDWASIYGVGGSSVIPSSLSTHYQRPRYRPYPSAAYAWALGTLGLFLCLPALIAIPIALHAARRGNRSAWLAAAWATMAAVLSVLLWRWVLPRSDP
jgi:hypothetical protein